MVSLTDSGAVTDIIMVHGAGTRLATGSNARAAGHGHVGKAARVPLVGVALHGGAEMDPSLIPIAAIVIGVPGTVAFIALVMGHARKMQELKIRERELAMGGSAAELRPVVDALCDDLNDTRAQVAEIQERLDFAERMLAAGRAPENDRSG